MTQKHLLSVINKYLEKSLKIFFKQKDRYESIMDYHDYKIVKVSKIENKKSALNKYLYFTDYDESKEYVKKAQFIRHEGGFISDKGNIINRKHFDDLLLIAKKLKTLDTGLVFFEKIDFSKNCKRLKFLTLRNTNLVEKFPEKLKILNIFSTHNENIDDLLQTAKKLKVLKCDMHGNFFPSQNIDIFLQKAKKLRVLRLPNTYEFRIDNFLKETKSLKVLKLGSTLYKYARLSHKEKWKLCRKSATIRDEFTLILPESLKILVIHHVFDRIINSFPKKLKKIIIMTNKLRINDTLGKLPKHLKILKIGRFFGQKIKKFPTGLKVLELKYDPTDKQFVNKLPKKLKKLTLFQDSSQVKEDVKEIIRDVNLDSNNPYSVTEIQDMIPIIKNPIKKLPKNLKVLILGEKFNQKIENIDKIKGLKVLELVDYSHEIEVFPKKLKKLILSRKYRFVGKLPKKLKTLIIYPWQLHLFKIPDDVTIIDARSYSKYSTHYTKLEIIK